MSGGGWGLISVGANNWVYHLQVNGPVTGGTYKWGEVGAYIQGAYKGMYFFLFTGTWACNWGEVGEFQ